MALFKNLFKKSEPASKSVTLKAQLTGKLIPIEEVPDPVFAEKMMGDGVAVDPTEGKVVSPVDGEVIQVFPTKHAIGIKATNGAEILIHIGLETVALKGEGFTTHIQQGSQVKQGDTLVTFDLDFIKEKAASTITPMIITNSADMAAVEKVSPGTVTAGQSDVLTVTSK